MERRRRLMEEQETKEWAYREGEIEKIQELRLQVLRKMLEEREKEHNSLNTKRLEHLWSKKQQEKEAKVKHLRKEHIKVIRKLTKERQNVEGKLERRDVIKSYVDGASETYAPLTRVGVFLDRSSERYSVTSHLLNTYQGLLELEASLPDYVMHPRVQARAPKRGSPVGGAAHRLERRVKELDKVDETIRMNKTKDTDSIKPLRFLEKVEKPIPRPPTPTIPTPSPDDESINQATIVLQKLIRGRATQNKMFEGKERRLELIRELRSTHALQSAGQKEKESMRYATLAEQETERREIDCDNRVDKVVEDLAGGHLGDALDYLSKELVRLQEERRVHAFAMMAERVRRMREAEESGMRQVEERRRRTEDEIFRQLVNVHQSTVDTYLEDVILSSVDKTADQQARLEVRKKAEKINEVAHAVEQQRTKLQSEEMVAELVHTFLLPEVEKQTNREKVMRQQRKHIVAAHRAIHEDGEKIIESHKIKPRDSLIKLTSKPDLLSSQSQILAEEDEDDIPNDDHHDEERKDEL
ncbi:cilia- and flagella-associated protein 91-like [Oscarella lobularis]|uniref:cilia- and flagella-associated protein 91-like n=1 Tax=Oscarella lobularis TaxID=121494 RepID=UPI0033142465